MKIEGKPFSAFDAAKLPGGLVPAVIQDDRTLQVLMLGYMNREAYEKSLAEGRVTFYSRSRQRLWTKGETSGNWLDIVSVAADCDCDTLLIRVIPHGPTCHTGSKTCFGEAVPETEGFIRYLQSVIRGRHAEMPEGSYTSKLFNQDRAEGRRGGCGDRHRGRGPEPRGDDLRGFGPRLPPARAARSHRMLDRRPRKRVGAQALLTPPGSVPTPEKAASGERM